MQNRLIIMMKTTGLFFLLLVSIFSQAETAVEIYQPSHKSAASLIKTIRPLYEPQAKVSTDGRQLIIKAEQPVIDEITELLLKLDHPTKLFRVEISSHADKIGSKTISTKKHSSIQQIFTVSENSTLTLSKAQTTSQVSSPWVQITTMPVDQEFVELNVQSTDATAYVNFTLQRIRNGRQSLISNQINGAFSEWMAITNAEPEQDNIRRWNTSNSDIEKLYIKVSPAN